MAGFDPAAEGRRRPLGSPTVRSSDKMEGRKGDQADGLEKETLDRPRILPRCLMKHHMRGTESHPDVREFVAHLCFEIPLVEKDDT